MAAAQRQYYEEAAYYALGVVDGEIPASRWIKLQCQRFLDDIEKISDPDFPYELDLEAAEKAAFFIEQMPLTKVKGKFKRHERPKLVLQPWQTFVVINLFGWVSKESGFRRYREALLFVPRKNGKSEFAAALALYALLADGEDAAEVYCGGRNERQANYIFKAAKRMLALNPHIKDHFHVKVEAENISVEATMSKMEKLIGNPEDGGDPHLYCCDEYHEHATDAQFDTMKTGMISRMQPLILVTTTAGINIEGPCYRYVKDAEKALLGVLKRPDWFIMIFTIDDGDDWKTEESLAKANPGYGSIFPKAQLQSDQQAAVASVRKASRFKIKHLNIWQGSEESYFDVEAWIKSAAPEAERAEEYWHGNECYIGVDLSGWRDLTVALRLFPKPNGGFHIIPKFYLPKRTLDDLYDLDSDMAVWAESGHIHLTDGAMVDVQEVVDDIKRWRKIHQVREVAFDKSHSIAFVQLVQLNPELMPLLAEFPNKAAYMSEPMKTCDGLVVEGKVTHDDNQVMTWMISNVVRKTTTRDDLDYPAKANGVYENKIDGPVAMLMAYGRMQVAPLPFEPGIVKV